MINDKMNAVKGQGGTPFLPTHGYLIGFCPHIFASDIMEYIKLIR